MGEVSHDIRVDPEIRDLIPRPTGSERAGLERSILEEGVRDPLVVWEDGPERILLDGHNRHEIATGNNADGEVLPFSWVGREFRDKAAAKVWVIENQLEHRRNLSDADKIDLAETKRELIEQSHPRNQHSPGQNSAPAPKDERRTDARVGKDAGTSRDTVRKYRHVKRFGDGRLVEGLRSQAFSMDNAYHLALVGEACGPETYGALWEHEDHTDEKTGRARNVRHSTAQLKHLLRLSETGNPDETTADLVGIVESGQPHPETDRPITSVYAAHNLRQAERGEGPTSTSDGTPRMGDLLEQAGVSLDDMPRRSAAEEAFFPVQIKAREIRRFDAETYAKACPEVRYLDDAIGNLEELADWARQTAEALKDERRRSTQLRAVE